ncbi:MAG: glycosyltransferase family 4 protein [Cryobacterium sp.]|nr:glycosyltransferase family 4 protein [Cryobacterium sp.]
MRFFFDCRYTRLGRHDGISRYGAKLVEAFSKLHPVTMIISDKAQLDMLPDLPWVLASSPTSLKEPWVSLEINRFEPDVVFTPMQTMGSIGRKYKLILTLHDLIYYKSPTPPRDLSWFIRLGWRLYHLAYWPQRLTMNRADEVVTGTETAKAQIIQHHLTDRPITVVSSAVEPAPKRTSTREKTIVYMGSFMPYKNVELLARAMNGLPDYKLQLLSRIGDSDRARLSSLAPKDSIEFLNGVSDEEYSQILRRCTALATASFEEGFGIPVVEALAMGTPVICSDIPVFHETAGESALFFDPNDPEDVVAKVRELEDDSTWKRLSDSAPAQAGKFTWDKSAKHLFDLVMSLAAKPK